MDLKAIDNSQVVYLTNARRPKGQLFLPVALEALLNRYHFQKYPSQQELLSDTLIFQHGVFDDVGINQLSIHQDGVIATSRANTDLLDNFIDNLLSWAEEALGLVQTDLPPQERHYESNIIVGMNIREERSLPFLKGLNDFLRRRQEAYGLRPFEFAFSALQVANDATTYGGRKPIPFTIVRRVNVPFHANIYYSSAPLKTDDHLAALKALEEDLN